MIFPQKSSMILFKTIMAKRIHDNNIIVIGIEKKV